MYIISLNDDEGPYFWRAVAGMPIALGVLALTLDLIFVRRMNSLKYLVTELGVEKAKEQAYKIYEKTTADELCEDFQKVIDEGQTATKSKKSFFREIKDNRRQFFHIVLVTLLVGYSCYTLYESYFVYITTYDLNNLVDVDKSKFWALIAVISETVGYLINSVLDLGKNPRKLLVCCYWLAIASASLVSAGYCFDNLSFARYSSVTHGLSLAAIWGGFNPYYLSILPPALNGVPLIILNFNNAVINQLFPLFLTPETPHRSWAYAFGGLACLVCFCWITLMCVLK